MAVKVVVVGEVNMKQLAQAQRELDKLKKNAGGASGKMQSLGQSFASTATKAAAIGGAMAAAGYIAWDFIKAASNLNEAQTKSAVVFGRSSAAVEQWAKTAAAGFGQSQRQATEAAAGFGSLFTTMGLGTSTAAEMSTRFVELASDMASFSNSTPEEALLALRSGLVGETEPLRKFDVMLNDAALRQKALEMGLVSTTKSVLPPAIKAQASYALILEQTTKAQGDYSRTQGGIANQVRAMGAAWEDAKAGLGEFLATEGQVAQGLTARTAVLRTWTDKGFVAAIKLVGKSYTMTEDEFMNYVKTQKAAIPAITGNTTAIRGQTEALDELTASTKKQVNAQYELEDADIADKRSHYALKDAKKAMTAAIKEHGRKSREAKEATLDYRDAVLAAKRADDRVAESKGINQQLEALRRGWQRAADAVGRYKDRAARANGNIGRIPKAAGDIMPATAGGWDVTVGEAGSAEAIIPINNRARSYDLLYETMQRMGVNVASGAVVVNVNSSNASASQIALEVERALKRTVRTSGALGRV